MKRLTWCDLPNGERYEVLDGRFVQGPRHSFYVRFSKNGVTISDRVYTTEVEARKNFERLVEEKANA